jgi:hypothetical protein
LIRFCELVVRINRKVARPCVRIHVLTAYENDMQLETLQSAFNELAESLRVRRRCKLLGSPCHLLTTRHAHAHAHAHARTTL